MKILIHKKTFYMLNRDNSTNICPSLSLFFSLLLFVFICLFRYVCQEDWPSPHYNNYYTFALLVLQFVIPLLVLIFTYSRIAIAVWGKRPPGEAQNSRDQRMARSKRKVSHTNSYSQFLCH